MKWIAAASLFICSSLASAGSLTNVQVSGGGVLYGTDLTEYNTEIPTTLGVRLLISGQIHDRFDMLWYDLFHHQGAEATFKDKNDNSVENTVSAGFTGSGLKLSTSESRPFTAFARAGGVVSQYSIQSENTQTKTEDTEYSNHFGYYVGSGFSVRLNSDSRIVSEYTGYKLNSIYKFQHTFQVGVAYYF